MFYLQKWDKETRSFVTSGKFRTFQEAYEYAIQNVCADTCNEGNKNSVYYFSDESSPDLPYKIRIEFVKETK